MTFTQTFLTLGPVNGDFGGLHALTHSGNSGRVADAIGWHVRHFGRMVQRLRDTPEGAGTMLETTIVPLMIAGGHGFNPEDGNTSRAHSTENMTCLYAGCSDGLQAGTHIQTENAHPAQLLITLMNELGVETNSTLGEVTGEIPALRA